MPELVGNGREIWRDLGIQQLAKLGVLTLSKHGEKVVVIQGEQGRELQLQEMTLTRSQDQKENRDDKDDCLTTGSCPRNVSNVV